MTIGISVFIQVIGYVLGRFFLFHLHINFCLVMSEALRSLAVSLAILLCVSNWIRTRFAFIRFIWLLVVMAGLGWIAARLNPWTFLPGIMYPLLYCVCACIFWMGNTVVRYVIKKLTSPKCYMCWHTAWFLFIGLVPMLVLATTQYILSRSIQLQSSQVLFRMLIFYCSLFCLPYAIYACFLILAGSSTLWRERLDRCFELPCSEVS